MDRMLVGRRRFLKMSLGGLAGLVVPPILIANRAGQVEATTWRTAVCSSYGPGLYGNRTACGQILRADTIGVAHRTLACGTRLKFLGRTGQIVYARVIDRGPFVAGREFDLTEETVQRMGYRSARDFGVRSVRWAYA